MTGILAALATPPQLQPRYPLGSSRRSIGDKGYGPIRGVRVQPATPGEVLAGADGAGWGGGAAGGPRAPGPPAPGESGVPGGAPGAERGGGASSRRTGPLRGAQPARSRRVARTPIASRSPASASAGSVPRPQGA